MRILLIEDQRDLAAVLADGLRYSGFAVDTARTMDEASEAAVVAPYDMISSIGNCRTATGSTGCASSAEWARRRRSS